MLEKNLNRKNLNPQKRLNKSYPKELELLQAAVLEKNLNRKNLSPKK